MLKWSTTDQEAALHGVKCLVVGESGIGKTVLLSTMPDPIILSGESGLLSLRRVSIPVLKFTCLADINDAYEWLTESRDSGRFRSVGIDSLSEMAEVVLAEELKLVKDPRQAYGAMATKMEVIIRSFRDLAEKNVCFTSKIEPMRDEMTGAVKYAASVPGKALPPMIPYFFDEVFIMRVAQPPSGPSYRYLQTQPDLQYVSKDRSGNLAAVEKPDLAYIFKKIIGA